MSDITGSEEIMRKERRGHLPPRTTGPVGMVPLAPPPARDRGAEATGELARVLREGFQKVADSLDNAMAGVTVTNAIHREVGRQERRWGLASWPDGTGLEVAPLGGLSALGPLHAMPAGELAARARERCNQREAAGEMTWWDVLIEEVLESAAEDPSLANDKLDQELIQVGAVIVSWVKDRNRRRQRERDLATKGYDPAEGPVS